MNASVTPLSVPARALRQDQLFAVLEPIARVARLNGFSIAEVMALMREAFLSATRAETPESPSTQARSSIESGLTRSDIQSITALKEERDRYVLAERRRKRVAGRVAEIWTTHPRCSAPYGCGLPLPVGAHTPRAESHEGRLTFEDLVRMVDREIDPSEVLATMMEAGSASWADDEQTSVSVSAEFALILGQGGDPTFSYVTSTLSGIAKTLATNAYGLYSGPKLFERRAISDRIVDELGLLEVNERLRARLSSSLESFSADLEKPDPTAEDRAIGEDSYRACIGFYVMAERSDMPLVHDISNTKRRSKTIDLAMPNPVVSNDE